MRAAAAAAILFTAGCGLTAPHPPRQSEAMERSARMLRALDKLEADLHSQNAETGVYNELIGRHAQAQEIACKVTDEHVEEIHRLAALQEQKIEEKRRVRRKKAVAQFIRRGDRRG